MASAAGTVRIADLHAGTGRVICSIMLPVDTMRIAGRGGGRLLLSHTGEIIVIHHGVRTAIWPLPGDARDSEGVIFGAEW